MPQQHAAEKDLRKNKRRAARNNRTTVALEVAARQFKKAAAGTDSAALKTAYQSVVKIVDRAASKGIIPKNRAARIKSRLSKKLSSGKK